MLLVINLNINFIIKITDYRAVGLGSITYNAVHIQTARPPTGGLLRWMRFQKDGLRVSIEEGLR